MQVREILNILHILAYHCLYHIFETKAAQDPGRR
jgi:hypothetical protein